MRFPQQRKAASWLPIPMPPEPETINERLLLTSKELLENWSTVLSSLGQDPEKNTAVARLKKQIKEAEELLP